MMIIKHHISHHSRHQKFSRHQTQTGDQHYCHWQVVHHLVHVDQHRVDQLHNHGFTVHGIWRSGWVAKQLDSLVFVLTQPPNLDVVFLLRAGCSTSPPVPGQYHPNTVQCFFERTSLCWYWPTMNKILIHNSISDGSGCYPSCPS